MLITTRYDRHACVWVGLFTPQLLDLFEVYVYIDVVSGGESLQLK